MALGGGLFTAQNKVLPGTYINFISASRASASLSDRGFAALPVVLDWGADGKVFTVTQKEFKEETQKYFGYVYDAAELKKLRDLYAHAKTVYFYRVNTGTKASNEYANAKYSGTRGNDIRIVIQDSIEKENAFDVSTYLDSTRVDLQTVLTPEELLGNDYVDWKENMQLKAVAGTTLTVGTNKE